MIPPATSVPKLRVALVTNIPAPYRVPVYDLVAGNDEITFTAIYAARSESDRSWNLPNFAHDHVFLEGQVHERAGRFIHYNPDVWQALVMFNPDVVITTGFNPTHLIAFVFAVLNGRRHVAMTDGTALSEIRLSVVHRWVRRLVFAGSRTFIAASEGGWRLYRSYGVSDDSIHLSPLCANTAVSWDRPASCERDLDLLFSGRLVAIKNPDFALRVAQGVARQLGRRIRLGMLGSGPLQGRLIAQAAALADDVDVVFAGHVLQSEVPSWFHRARVFLFPTSWDPWGIVANEACVARVPVVVSPHAGVAGELIRDGESGLVRALDLPAWVSATAALLQNPQRTQRMGDAAHDIAAPYNFKNAAAGIVAAALQAHTGQRPSAPAAAFRPRPRVVCVQRRLAHYRVGLFEQLRDYLRQRGVDFVLVHGDAAPSEIAKNDGGHLPWALPVPCRYWMNERLCWQDLSDAVAGADLVIVTQENKLLYNLLAMTVRRPRRLAFWGHGRNFQSSGTSLLRERFKRWTTRHVDWWFAYTSLSAAQVIKDGTPPDRVTTLDNAIDTTALLAQCDAVSASDVSAFRQRWGLGDGPLGVFVGSLYGDKRLGFLIEAATLIARQRPDFRLVVVGAGPDRQWVESAAQRLPWLRYVGPQFGPAKALCLRSASVMLNPGLVGLGILDAFAAGIPLITTDCGLHSPEIAYLETGQNGLMTADTVPAFSSACSGLLADSEALRRMGDMAKACASIYNIQHMTQRFGDGILAALETPAT